ncbi:hypothetical protein FJY90_07510 [Candidatus Gottesmanbacteria bacterium]|nr:hypothetical protein [Candidatus Gottesmanbacteria bacterium]
MQDATYTAIKASLSRDWKKAISLNQALLEKTPNDISAMNRLAYAYIQIQKIEEAKKIYHKILTLDKYDLIARKNLNKISCLTKKTKKIKQVSRNQASISPGLFIEEAGKTKTVTLIHPPQAEVLSNISSGDTVRLFPKKHSIEVRDYNNVYLGVLPDDIAFRLLYLIRAGNEYLTIVKNVSKNSLSVFIREIKRSKRFLHQPSFIIPLSNEKHSMHPPKHEDAEE